VGNRPSSWPVCCTIPSVELKLFREKEREKIGLFAVLFHLLSSSYSGKKSGKKFLKTYFWSLFLRFLVVCILFALIIIWTNIEEISFTFSFVISYLYHSVIEVVLLNKKLSD